MNLNEYKRNKIKEVDFFLRGIYFDNINTKDKKIIIDLSLNCGEDLSLDCEKFFNTYRNATEMFLLRIKELRGEFIYTDLEFAGTKEEVDLAVKALIDNIRNELNNYKATIMKEVFGSPRVAKSNGVDVLLNPIEYSLLNTGLNFINIKIGNDIFQAYRDGTEAEKETVVVDNLNIMIVYVYTITCMIKDKKDKQSYFIDYVSDNFKVTDPNYLDIHKLRNVFFGEKNYNEFIRKYDDAMKRIEELLENKKNKGKD